MQSQSLPPAPAKKTPLGMRVAKWVAVVGIFMALSTRLLLAQPSWFTIWWVAAALLVVGGLVVWLAYFRRAYGQW